MSHKVGVYWSPHHEQGPVLDYIARLKPPVIRVLTEDVQHISDAHAASPNSIIIPRVWRIDDDSGRARHEMMQNPTLAGNTHARQMVEFVKSKRREAVARGLPFPKQSQIIIGGANEPNQSGDESVYPIICDYARAFGYTSYNEGYRAVLLILGVGHPSGLFPDGTVNWNAFLPLQPILDQGSHWVETHGYNQKEGPVNGEDYPYLAGRHHSCPLNAPHLVGECGVDGGIFDRDPGWGWGDYGLSVDEYSAQLELNHDMLAPNVVAMLPFTSDYQADEWKGFDVRPVHESILVWSATKNGGTVIPPNPSDPHNVFMPIVSNGGDDFVDAETGFLNAVEFILEFEGGYVNHPNDPGGETNFGISKRAHPDVDIKNLTRDDAIAIYKREYWKPVAAKLWYPLSLVYFDTAVLHGPNAAAEWFAKYEGAHDKGDEEWAIIIGMLYERAKIYLRSKNREIFGDGWTIRLLALEAEVNA